jgi:hypothetical protein
MSDNEMPVVTIVARTPGIADMVDQCARGQLPFSGPSSLCSWLRERGYTSTGAYEMVCAREWELRTQEPQP